MTGDFVVEPMGEAVVEPEGTLAPYQTRVVTERQELSDRYIKLMTFINSPAFGNVDMAERTRMLDQAQAMKLYETILTDRIEHFKLIKKIGGK